jgi:hypothetical protein
VLLSISARRTAHPLMPVFPAPELARPHAFLRENLFHPPQELCADDLAGALGGFAVASSQQPDPQDQPSLLRKLRQPLVLRGRRRKGLLDDACHPRRAMVSMVGLRTPKGAPTSTASRALASANDPVTRGNLILTPSTLCSTGK